MNVWPRRRVSILISAPSCLSGRWTNHDTTWDVLYVLRPGENRDFVWAPCCLGSGGGERSLFPGGLAELGFLWDHLGSVLQGDHDRVERVYSLITEWGGPAVGSGFVSTGFHQHLCQGRQEATGPVQGPFLQGCLVLFLAAGF